MKNNYFQLFSTLVNFFHCFDKKIYIFSVLLDVKSLKNIKILFKSKKVHLEQNKLTNLSSINNFFLIFLFLPNIFFV